MISDSGLLFWATLYVCTIEMRQFQNCFWNCFVSVSFQLCGHFTIKQLCFNTSAETKRFLFQFQWPP